MQQRIGNQIPTQSVVSDYEETKGNDAVEIYNKPVELHRSGKLGWYVTLWHLIKMDCGHILNMGIHYQEEMERRKLFI